MNQKRKFARKIGSLALGMLATLSAITAIAADDNVITQLTGGSSREWVYRRIVRMMGASDACTSGETYTFSSDHVVAIAECTGGHVVVTRHKWSATTDADSEIVLSIETAPVQILLFSERDGNHFIHLRTPSDGRATPVIDKELELNQE